MNILIIAFAFLNLIVLTNISLTTAEINMTMYQKLPPLYNFDNYDHCLSQKNAAYCIVFAEVQPNNYSDIWFDIENLSNDLYHHYRHENLFFGVCLEQCKQLFNDLPVQERQRFAQNKTLENEITEFHRATHKRPGDRENRLLYQNILDVCLNYRFQQQFNLSLTTSVEYCDISEQTWKFDLLDIIFYTILIAIILLNIISSLYDYRLKRKYKNYENNDFYKSKHPDYNQFLSSFSICRNYYRIVGFNSKESDTNFTYAYRVLTLFFVTLGHTFMGLTSMQIQNPEFIENILYKAAAMIFGNGTAVIQIFFVIAGFLLKLKFDESNLITSETSFKTGLTVYLQGFFNRYLRFFPSLMMVILFSATILPRLGDGPFWRHASESDYTFCREYWWKNIFMINNFMFKDSCAPHTWFLATDMQLYLLFLFTVILTSKFKSWKKPLYTLLGIFAFLVPGLLTYFYKLEATHSIKPEGFRYMYFKDFEEIYLTYTQFYCNMGGYLVGFMCADFYLKYIRTEKNRFSKYRGVMKFEITLLALIILAPFGLFFSGNLVVHTNIEKPSLWLSLYASLYRNIWTIYGGFLILCMLMKMGWIAYEIACLPVFRVMGRISFQSYIWHVTVLRILGGFNRQPIYLNKFYAVCFVILVFIITNFLAFWIALFVEYPMSEVVHSIFKKKTQNQKSGNDVEMKSNEV